MANTIITKNSSTASAVPTSGDLVQGELAVNVTDKRLFTENSGGTVVEVGTNPSSIAVAGNATVGGTLGVTGLATLASSTLTANPTLSGGTANGVTYLNGSKVLTSGSALTFDGTNLGVGTSSPDTKLNVYGGSLRINNATTGAGSGLIVGMNSNDVFISNQANGYILFGTNNTERMRLTSTGLGIGTSSPSYPLHVNATGNGTKARFTNGTTTLDLYCGGTEVYTGTAGSSTSWAYATANTYIAGYVNGSERLRLDSSGNLGLGVTPSASSSLIKAFDFNTTGGIGSYSNSTSTQFTYVSSNAFINSSVNWTYKFTGYAAAAYMQNNGSAAHAWFTAPSGTAGNAISFTQAMTLAANGDLSIGTTATPAQLWLSSSSSTVGVAARATGYLVAARDNDYALQLNRISSDGDIAVFRKNGATVGSIGSRSSGLYIAKGNTNIVVYDDGTTNSVFPESGSDPTRLGLPSAPFSDLYLSGGVISSSGSVYIGRTDLNTSLWIGNSTINPGTGSGTGRDNAIDLGYSSYRFDDIYATNGTIQTSDRNEKQDIETLSEAEARVAVACKGLLRKFRWKDAVAEKGDEARIHFGIIAQDLQAAFAAEGLDAGRYAMFISSTWTDEETGEERTRLGVRYPELLAFIIAAI